MSLKERLSNSLSEEDKERLKEGAKSSWYQFTEFVDKFTELIFGMFNLFFDVLTIFFSLCSTRNCSWIYRFLDNSTQGQRKQR